MAAEAVDLRKPVFRFRRAWSDPWKKVVPGTVLLEGRIDDGYCAKVGAATLKLFAASPDNRESGAPPWPEWEVDDYVQIGAALPEEIDDGTAWTSTKTDWLFTGVISQIEFDHRGTDKPNLIRWFTISLEGIATLLNRVIANRCRLAVGTQALTVAGRCPPFNGSGYPDRAVLPTPPDGVPRPCIDRRRDQSPAPWSARQVIDQVLELHLTPEERPGWPTFRLVGQVTALNYLVSDFAYEGQSLFWIIGQLVNVNRGLGWRCRVVQDGDQLVVWIDVGTFAEADILIGSTVVVPAAARQSVLLVDRPHHTLRSMVLDRDRSLELRGAPVRTVLTLGFRPGAVGGAASLLRGWAESDDDQAGSPDPQYINVWRVFRLASDWNGRTWYQNSGDPIDGCATRQLDRTEPYPLPSSPAVVTGTDGEREFNGADSFPALLAGIDAGLPLPLLAKSGATARRLDEWVDDTSGTIALDRKQPQLKPLIFAGIDDTWIELTGKISLELRNDPQPTLILGDSPADAAKLAASVGEGWLLITLAVEEPLPLAVTWRPPGTAPLERYRSIPELELSRVAAGAVLGVQGSTLLRPSNSKAIRDDRPILRALLRLAKGFLDRRGGGQVADRAALHPADDLRAPGCWVPLISDGSTLTNGQYDPAGYHDARMVITGRSWGFSPDDYGTVLTLDVPPLNVTAFV